VLHPASLSAQRVAIEQKVAAKAAPAVRTEELTAIRWFERGLDAADADERLRLYTEVLRLKPDDAFAFKNRGLAHFTKGDVEGALQDYAEAIRINPDDADVFVDRGLAGFIKRDLEGAMKDFTEIVRLKPDYAFAYKCRGMARGVKGDKEDELQDFNEAIRLNPKNAHIFFQRSLARRAKGMSRARYRTTPRPSGWDTNPKSKRARQKPHA
jgi:tetratricopeptide (TPR) repeat protein